MITRCLKGCWLGLFLIVSGAGCQQVASYPNRTVVVICPWAAGGGTDRTARFLADQLQQQLHQPVVVQNQTGGSGATGHAAGARARPDGYTLLIGTFELSTMRSLGISELTYRDYLPLAQLNADPAALIVRQDAPWQTLREFLDAVRQRPRELKLSGTAAGGAWDLARAGLLLAAGLPVDAVTWVPSQGAAPSLVELLGGHVDAVCCSLPEALSQWEAGQVRPLCVMAAERMAEFPEIPTAREQGIDWVATGWRGLFLPRRTPPEVVEVLTKALDQIVHSEPYREFLHKNRFGDVYRTGEDFVRYLDEQERRWGEVIRAAGLSATPGQPRVVTTHDPGPWFVPRVLSVALTVGTLLVWLFVVLRKIREGRLRGWLTRGWLWVMFWREPGSRNVVALVLALVGYLLVMPWLGFLPASWLLAAGMLGWLGAGWKQVVGVPTGMMLVVYFLFVVQLRLVLPQGCWWPQ